MMEKDPCGEWGGQGGGLERSVTWRAQFRREMLPSTSPSALLGTAVGCKVPQRDGGRGVREGHGKQMFQGSNLGCCRIRVTLTTTARRYGALTVTLPLANVSATNLQDSSVL